MEVGRLMGVVGIVCGVGRYLKSELSVFWGAGIFWGSNIGDGDGGWQVDEGCRYCLGG